MKHEELLRELFIESAISLVAEGGFEKVTTRAIVHDRARLDEVRLNEAHIYRMVGGKEGLFASAFAKIDLELVSLVRQSRDFCGGFLAVWRYLCANEKKCLFYARFYYSIYFCGAAKEKHVSAYGTILANRLLVAALNMAIELLGGEDVSESDVRLVLETLMMVCDDSPRNL